MQGSSAPLRGALLGLMLERPGHGGDLASRLDRRLGEVWRIDPTDIYRLLAGLEKEGLVCGRDEAADDSHVSRVVYYPTAQSQAALTVWLETAFPREPMRSALHAKLAAACEETDAAVLVRALEVHERECLDMAKLLPPAAAGNSWRSMCLAGVRAGIWAQLQAEVDWSRETRRRLNEFVAGI